MINNDATLQHNSPCELTVIKISFIIATRNRPDALARCIQSIQKHETCDVEIIIIDDFSIPNLSPEFKNVDNLFIIRNSTNIGPAGSRNIGLSVARAPLVFFLDDDAYLTQRSSVIAANILESNSSVGAVAFPIYEKTMGELIYAVQPGWAKTAAAGAVVYRRNDLLSIGGFDARMKWCEELDLAIRLRDGIGQVWNVASPIVIHESTNISNAMTNGKFAYILSARLHTYWKNFSPYTVVLFTFRTLLTYLASAIRHRLLTGYTIGIFYFIHGLPNILKDRRQVSKETELLFTEINLLEDENSIPLYMKFMRKCQALIRYFSSISNRK